MKSTSEGIRFFHMNRLSTPEAAFEAAKNPIAVKGPRALHFWILEPLFPL